MFTQSIFCSHKERFVSIKNKYLKILRNATLNVCLACGKCSFPYERFFIVLLTYQEIAAALFRFNKLIFCLKK